MYEIAKTLVKSKRFELRKGIQKSPTNLNRTKTKNPN